MAQTLEESCPSPGEQDLTFRGAPSLSWERDRAPLQGPQRSGRLMALAHPASSAPSSSPLCLAEPSQRPTQGSRAARLLLGRRT